MSTILQNPSLQLPLAFGLTALIAWGGMQLTTTSPEPVAQSYVMQGLERYNNRDLQGAWLDYTKALALDPATAEAYYYRAGVHHFFGNKVGAKADLQQAALLFEETQNDRYLQLTRNRLAQLK